MDRHGRFCERGGHHGRIGGNMAKRTNLDALGKLAEDRKKGAANGSRIAWKGADGSSFTITPSKGQGPGTEDWDNAVGTANKAFTAGRTSTPAGSAGSSGARAPLPMSHEQEMAASASHFANSRGTSREGMARTPRTYPTDPQQREQFLMNESDAMIAGVNADQAYQIGRNLDAPLPGPAQGPNPAYRQQLDAMLSDANAMPQQIAAASQGINAAVAQQTPTTPMGQPATTQTGDAINKAWSQRPGRISPTSNVPPAQIQDETGKVIDNPARAEYRAQLTAQMDAFKAKRGEFEAGRSGKMTLDEAKTAGMTKYAATLAGGKTSLEAIGDLQEEKEKQAGATGRTEKTIASNEQITEMISQREASKDKAEMARLDKEIAAAKEKQGVEIKQKTVEVDQRFEIESAKLKQAAADKTDANKQAMAKHDLGIYKIKGELYKSLLGAWYEADAGPEKDALMEQAQALYAEMQGLAGGGAMGGAAAQPPPQPTTQPTTQPSQEGQAPPTATNPQTGEQLVFKDGIWQ